MTLETSAWHTLSVVDVAAIQAVDPTVGLDIADVMRRLAVYSTNELTCAKRLSSWKLLLRQFENPLTVVLLTAIVLASCLGELVNTVIIGIIVCFCAGLGFIQEYRSEQALKALQKMLAPMAMVLRGGVEQEIAVIELVPGDVLLLKAGDMIPADARVIETHALSVNEASLTGESAPVAKTTASVPTAARLAERLCMLFAGTTVVCGRGRAIVTATGMGTELGAIVHEVTAVVTNTTPLEQCIAKIGKWLGGIAVVVCCIVVGVSITRALLTNILDWPFVLRMAMFAVALAVAVVPEALAAIVTGVLAIGMRRMAKSHVLVRRMAAVETLGCTTVICSDKTGTLTTGEMTVRQLYCAGHLVEVTGSGYMPEGQYLLAGMPIDLLSVDLGLALQKLLIAALLCNDADLSTLEGSVCREWKIKGDPTEAALLVAAIKAGLDYVTLRRDLSREEELPFSSERRCMTTLHRFRHGRFLAIMKGAPETVLGCCTYWQGISTLQPMDSITGQTIREINAGMADNALRVLAFACREFEPETVTTNGNQGEVRPGLLEQDLTFLGLAGVMDPPRLDAAAAVAICRRVGIRPVMVTGDQPLTAIAVARELDILQPGDQVVTGNELEAMDETELISRVSQVAVYAAVSPLDKLKIVRAWKARGEVVAMTGDGVNDAPALKHADIGVAMGRSGTAVAREAADMVLMDDNFASIVKAVELGRWIFDNIQKYLAFLLRCNITEICVVGGVVLASGPDFLPLLPAAILYINLATDGLPALALGIAPPDPDLMERPPRDPRVGIFSLEFLIFVGLSLVVEIPVFLVLFYIWSQDIIEARTVLFLLFLLVEMTIALNFRSLRYGVFVAPPHRWLWLAIGWELLLAVVLLAIPAVRKTFGIGLPSWVQLSSALGLCALAFLAMEGLKVWLWRSDREIRGCVKGWHRKMANKARK